MTHPGDLVFRLPAIGAVALVVINDHVLRARYGNWLTGKLSDVAGVFVLPLIALSVIEVGRWGVRRMSWQVNEVEVFGAILVTGIGFAAVKLIGPVGDAYASTIGGLRWIARRAVASDAPYAPIEVTRDWTDVLVLPVLAGTWIAAKSRIGLSADRAVERTGDGGS